MKTLRVKAKSNLMEKSLDIPINIVQPPDSVIPPPGNVAFALFVDYYLYKPADQTTPITYNKVSAYLALYNFDEDVRLVRFDIILNNSMIYGSGTNVFLPKGNGISVLLVKGFTDLAYRYNQPSATFKVVYELEFSDGRREKFETESITITNLPLQASQWFGASDIINSYKLVDRNGNLVVDEQYTFQRIFHDSFYYSIERGWGNDYILLGANGSTSAQSIDVSSDFKVANRAGLITLPQLNISGSIWRSAIINASNNNRVAIGFKLSNVIRNDTNARTLVTVHPRYIDDRNHYIVRLVILPTYDSRTSTFKGYLEFGKKINGSYTFSAKSDMKTLFYDPAGIGPYYITCEAIGFNPTIIRAAIGIRGIVERWDIIAEDNTPELNIDQNYKVGVRFATSSSTTTGNSTDLPITLRIDEITVYKAVKS